MMPFYLLCQCAMDIEVANKKKEILRTTGLFVVGKMKKKLPADEGQAGCFAQ